MMCLCAVFETMYSLTESRNGRMFRCIVFLFSSVVQTYHDSIKKLRLMTDAELTITFGHIDTLVPLHQGEYASKSY